MSPQFANHPGVPPRDARHGSIAVFGFNEVKNKQSHVIGEGIVADIDSILEIVCLDGGQTTTQGEREVQQAPCARRC